MIEEHRIRIDGHTIHYSAAGQGRPVVLLHGLSGSTRWWQKNIAVLANSFRVYALDLLGFGGSRGQVFGLEQAIDLTARWIDGLGSQPVHLVGHSMGGIVAVRLALRRPEKVSRLVLVDAVSLPLHRSVVNSALRLPLALHYAAPDFWPVLASDALRAGPRNLLTATLAIHRADLTAELSQLTCPVLVVWGEKDMLLPAPIGINLHHLLPGSRLEVLAGSGHNPMWDRPQAFNALVTAFLQDDDHGL